MHREQKYTYTPAHRTHTICTHTNKTIMQHIQDNKDTDNREQNKDTHNLNAQHSTQNSAHNYRTYSLDYYFEYAYIKNSNTIELYTISK